MLGGQRIRFDGSSGSARKSAPDQRVFSESSNSVAREELADRGDNQELPRWLESGQVPAMDPKTEGRVFFFIAVALALVGIVVPYRWHKMPPWLVEAAFVFALISSSFAAWSAVPATIKLGAPRMLSILMVASGVIIAVVGMYLLIGRKPPASAIGSPLDNTIGMRCNLSRAPTHFREDRPLYMMQIGNAPIKEASPTHLSVFTTFFMQGTDLIKWGDAEPAQVYRCTITNYGANPIFDVSAMIAVSWLEVIRSPGRVESGKFIARREFMSPKSNIGTGMNNEDYFYIWSNSDSYVQFEIPATIAVRTADQVEHAGIRLVPNTSPYVESVGSFPPSKGSAD